MLVALLIAGLLALLPTTAWAGDGGFAAGQELAVPHPSALAIGDFNNDGRPDLAVASEFKQRVDVFMRPRGGDFAAAPSVPVGKAPQLIAVGDFNADGNDDLAVGNADDRDVSIRLGVGDGTFTNAPDVEIGRYLYTLAVGDFNGDLKDDLALGTQSLTGPPHYIVVRLGAGDGKFTTGNDFADGAAALTVGDFNSDAIEDLVYGRFGPDSGGSLLRGVGGGVFLTRTAIPLPQIATFRRGWAVGDFNSDGKADVVAGLYSDRVSVRLGGGDGSFSGGSDVPAGARPGAVAVGDFNSDGNEDFVATDFSGTRTAQVRLGDGAGGFRAAADVPIGAVALDVAVADFDDDGTEDLAVANSEDDTVSIRPGTGSGPLAGNLLVNGGFEGPTPTGKIRPAQPILGWQLGGGMYYVRYGCPSHAFCPTWLASPRYGTGGGRMLWGGYSAPSDGVTTASQSVDVSGSAEAIDGGRATANLSGYLGGALNVPDTMTARAVFLDGFGSTLGSFAIGPVTAADRHNVTTLLRRADRAAVPAGTRQIRVTLTSNDADKSYSSALADNVKLTLTTAPAPAPPPPPPPPVAQFGARTLVTVSVARRIRSGRPLVVRVRNDNAFAITGVLRSAAKAGRARRAKQVALRRRALRVGVHAGTTVRLALPARLRRQLARSHALSLRLTALVRDPAGHTRQVTKQTRIRLRSPQ